MIHQKLKTAAAFAFLGATCFMGAQTQATATSTATAQAGGGASAHAASNVSAELTNGLSTKNAHVGDAVSARTTAAATLQDGTKLPKGTKLTGKVTEIQAKSTAEKGAHLAFSLDRAVLRDGHEVMLHSMVTGMSAAAATLPDDNADIGAVGQASGGASGGVSGGARTGGLLGGTARAAGGLVGGATRTVGGAATGLASTTSAVGAGVGAGLQIDHSPIANLPGVTLTSSMTANSSGSLDAAGRNIVLDSGTQLSLAVIAQP